MRPHLIAPWLLGLVLGACSPSVNPAYKTSIDQQVAALKPSGQRYEAPSAPDPMPLAVGQWSRYKLVDTEGNPGFVTYSVVGEADGAYWIELVNESYSARQVTLMLTDLGNRKDPQTVNVREMKTKSDDGTVNVLPGQMLGLMQSLWKPLIEGLIVDWRAKPQEVARVPAGSFDGCYKAQTTVSFVGKSSTSDTWSHPAVPINGAVKSRGVDNPSSLELVDFGTSGAKSELL